MYLKTSRVRRPRGGVDRRDDARTSERVTYDKLVYLTFNAPVQIPGATLNAATYRLANPDTSRNVLQVLSSDGATAYAMFHTIPDSRTSITGRNACS
jgi:hypothetical protein